MWGGLVLVGSVGQAAEEFWPSEKGSSIGVERPLEASSLKPSTSKLLPPIGSNPSSQHPPFPEATLLALKGGKEEPGENSKGSVVSEEEPGGANGATLVSAPSSEELPGGEDQHEGSPSGRAVPLRLGAPSAARPLSGVSRRSFDPTASTLTILSSLAVVLGVFLLLVWAIRRAMPRSAQLLPTEVVEVLGRAPLVGKQQMYLLRCGPKLLLLSVTPEGAETLTEIAHPDEVAHIVALCRQGQPGSIPAAFREILDQMARQQSGKGGGVPAGQVPHLPAELPQSAEEEVAHG